MTPDSQITFAIKSGLPLWLIILLVAIAFGLAYWSYRLTVPPAGVFLRWSMIMLRWAAITGGVLVIAKPLLELNRSNAVPAKIVVVVDKSASMGVSHRGIDRAYQVSSLMASDGFQRLNRDYRLEIYTFADTILNRWDDWRKAADDTPHHVGTNIGAAWGEVRGASTADAPAYFIIITDGDHNTGADPARLARMSRIPITTVGVGSTEFSRDALIASIVMNPVVYQGSRVPVEVGYRAVRAGDRTLSLTIRNAAGEIVSKRDLKVRGEFDEGTIPIELNLPDSGRLRFTASISRLDDEITYDNNSRGFYLNVLASRMKVLLFAGPPDNGLGDLVRRLKSDEHIELIQRTTKRSGFYEGSLPNEREWSELDVIVFHHFPVKTTNADVLDELIEGIDSHNLPLLFIDGGQIDYGRLQKFEDKLPMNIRRGRLKTTFGQVIPMGRHSVLVEANSELNLAQWTALPPTSYFDGLFTAKPTAAVLAEFQDAAGGSRSPALVVDERGLDKSAALLVRDLWLWGLASPGGEGVTQPLLSRLIRWLAVRRDDKYVTIGFDKDIYSNQEQVAFTVSVLDESYNPVDDAVLNAEISFEGKSSGMSLLNPIGSGRYRGNFHPWGEGEYAVTVHATAGERRLGEDKASITVEPFNIELLDYRLNEDLLRAVADASGGAYVPAPQADSLFANLELPDQESSVSRRIELYGRAWLLAAIIGALALEWLIRSRIGML